MTSRFGFALDLCLDRLTNSALFFFLAATYPKYWLVFLGIQFVQTASDLLDKVQANYQSVASLALHAAIRHENHLKLNETMSASNQTLTRSPIDSSSHLKAFLPLVWYTGGLFYWLLYMGSFVQRNRNSNRSDLVLDEPHRTGTTMKRSFSLFDDLAALFEDIGRFLEARFRGSPVLKLNSVPLLLRQHFLLLSRTTGFVFFLGAIGKSFLELRTGWWSLREILTLDEELRRLTPSTQT